MFFKFVGDTHMRASKQATYDIEGIQSDSQFPLPPQRDARTTTSATLIFGITISLLRRVEGGHKRAQIAVNGRRPQPEEEEDAALSSAAT